MDDVTGAKEKQQSAGQSHSSRRKYMDQLQEVADRRRDEVLIELDDVDNVCLESMPSVQEAYIFDSMRRISVRTWV